MNQVYFFKKNGVVAKKIDSEKFNNILPRSFMDKQMKVYVTERKYGIQAHEAFKAWCENSGTTSPVLSYSQSTQSFYDGFNNSSSSSLEDDFEKSMKETEKKEEMSNLIVIKPKQMYRSSSSE